MHGANVWASGTKSSCLVTPGSGAAEVTPSPTQSRRCEVLGDAVTTCREACLTELFVPLAPVPFAGVIHTLAERGHIKLDGAPQPM